MDCAVVVTPNGDTREYFGDYAQYCAPGDESFDPASSNGRFGRRTQSSPP